MTASQIIYFRARTGELLAALLRGTEWQVYENDPAAWAMRRVA